MPGAPRGSIRRAQPRQRHLGGRHPHDAEREVHVRLGAHVAARSARSRVDGATGKLTYLSSTPTEKQPRGFAIDPKGRFLVATGEKSETISVYAIDAANGALKPLGKYPTGKGANWVEIVSFD